MFVSQVNIVSQACSCLPGDVLCVDTNKSVGEESSSKVIARKSKETTKVVVPKDAVKFTLSDFSNSINVYQVQLN